MTGFYFGQQSLYFPSYTRTSESHAKTWSPVPSHQEDCIDASIIFWMVCHLGIFAWKVQWKNIIMKKRRKKWGPQTDYDCCSEKHNKKCVLQGGSGGVVNSLDFCPASLQSLGCFNGRWWRGISEFYSSNFKDIFGGPESECVWQQAITCCSRYRMPQILFSTNSWSCQQKNYAGTFFPPSIPFPW